MGLQLNGWVVAAASSNPAFFIGMLYQTFLVVGVQQGKVLCMVTRKCQRYDSLFFFSGQCVTTSCYCYLGPLMMGVGESLEWS